MARVTLIVTALVIALVSVFAGTTAAQTDTRDRTFLTFSGAVEMPGVTLPAAPTCSNSDTPLRNVVEVWNREEKQDDRPLAVRSGSNVPTCRRTRRDVQGDGGRPTPAVHFYYPGEKIGKEFVYPKAGGGGGSHQRARKARPTARSAPRRARARWTRRAR
jgi:hypothetical protein